MSIRTMLGLILGAEHRILDIVAGQGNFLKWMNECIHAEIGGLGWWYLEQEEFSCQEWNVMEWSGSLRTSLRPDSAAHWLNCFGKVNLSRPWFFHLWKHFSKMFSMAPTKPNSLILCLRGNSFNKRSDWYCPVDQTLQLSMNVLSGPLLLPTTYYVQGH